MKQNFFCLLFLIQTIAFAQAIATSSGISVQGLLKDTSGVPLSDVRNASLKFTLYYTDSNSSEVIISSTIDFVNTDDFGVFSYVLNIDNTAFDKVAFYQTYMRINNGLESIFDQKLYSVPYAVYARNGYPAGTILPYVGDNLPSGWLWCNGGIIPDDIFHSKIRTIIGGTTPNLSGVFMRGTGTHGTLVNFYEWGYNPQGRQTTYTGPLLGDFQNDAMSRHAHSRGDLGTSEAGRHNHPFRVDEIYANWFPLEGSGLGPGVDGHSAVFSPYDDEGLYDFTDETWRPIDYAGEHQHQFLGNTGSTGAANEVRPVNYGVNYIIKL